MNLNALVNRTSDLSFRLSINLAKRCCSNISTVKKEDNEIVDVSSADVQAKFHEHKLSSQEEAELRNKSRLSSSDRNILNGKKPYNHSMEWYHDTLRYKKRILGRYGMEAVEVPAGFAWPSKEEVEDKLEFERVSIPYNIHEEWKNFEEQKKLKAKIIRERDEEVAAKFAKLDEWKANLKSKLLKKQQELEAARLKKEKLIEEVRRHFGFKIDPKDERFKEVLDKKEKEEKKIRKEAKKKEKAARYLEKLKRSSENKVVDKADDTRESVQPVQ